MAHLVAATAGRETGNFILESVSYLNTQPATRSVLGLQRDRIILQWENGYVPGMRSEHVDQIFWQSSVGEIQYHTASARIRNPAAG
jgi:hypothetical protein